MGRCATALFPALTLPTTVGGFNPGPTRGADSLHSPRHSQLGALSRGSAAATRRGTSERYGGIPGLTRES
jgi:hypothetical protein